MSWLTPFKQPVIDALKQRHFLNDREPQRRQLKLFICHYKPSQPIKTTCSSVNTCTEALWRQKSPSMKRLTANFVDCLIFFSLKQRILQSFCVFAAVSLMCCVSSCSVCPHIDVCLIFLVYFTAMAPCSRAEKRRILHLHSARRPI